MTTGECSSAIPILVILVKTRIHDDSANFPIPGPLDVVAQSVEPVPPGFPFPSVVILELLPVGMDTFLVLFFLRLHPVPQFQPVFRVVLGQGGVGAGQGVDMFIGIHAVHVRQRVPWPKPVDVLIIGQCRVKPFNGPRSRAVPPHQRGQGFLLLPVILFVSHCLLLVKKSWLAGTDTTAIGPAPVSLAEGANTIVYAWGSAEGGNLALATQVITGLGEGPDVVPAGGGSTTGAPAWALALAGVAAIGLVGAGMRLSTSRR